MDINFLIAHHRVTHAVMPKILDYRSKIACNSFTGKVHARDFSALCFRVYPGKVWFSLHVVRSEKVKLLCTVWVKKFACCGFLTFFSKQLGIFNQLFLHTYYTFLSTQWCLCLCDRGRDEKCSPGQRFTDDDSLPKAVEALRGKYIVDVCVGPSHFLALTKSGAVYSWGCNDHGQLGHHDNSAKGVVARPSRVNTPTVAVGCRVAVHCGPLQVGSLLTVADLILFTVILSSLTSRAAAGTQVPDG